MRLTPGRRRPRTVALAASQVKPTQSLTILMLISSEIPDENGRCRVKEQRELGVGADGHGLS
uniref:Uncharacterized protein n=1 Tax=Oryza barthii TaxID=65489 RepID=A0A0D3H7X7_9ORYZ